MGSNGSNDESRGVLSLVASSVLTSHKTAHDVSTTHGQERCKGLTPSYLSSTTRRGHSEVSGLAALAEQSAVSEVA